MRDKRANFHDGSCRWQAHKKPNVRTHSRPSKCTPILLIGGSPRTDIQLQRILSVYAQESLLKPETFIYKLPWVTQKYR